MLSLSLNRKIICIILIIVIVKLLLSDQMNPLRDDLKSVAEEYFHLKVFLSLFM